MFASPKNRFQDTLARAAGKFEPPQPRRGSAQLTLSALRQTAGK
jgi:hypothetical protein